MKTSQDRWAEVAAPWFPHILREMYCKSLLVPSCLNLASGLVFGATDVISLSEFIDTTSSVMEDTEISLGETSLCCYDLSLFFICKGCIS